MQKANEVKLTVNHLSKAHGVCQGTIAKWAKKGAFPHILLRGKERSAMRFYPESLKYTLGEIKSNIRNLKHTKPILVIETTQKKSKLANPKTETDQNAFVMSEQFFRIWKKLERIEGKIDNIQSLCSQ